MKKKRVQIPFNIHNRFLVYFFQSKTGLVLSYWVSQGMRYMNKYERLHRICSEIIITAVFVLFLAQATSRGLALAISFLVVHTLFFLFNGHFYVLMRYIVNRKNDPEKFLVFLEGLHKRIKKPYLLGGAAFGSLSKGKFGHSSDFDVRLLRKKGFLNSLKAFNYCSLERAKAFFRAFPLDIYVFDVEELKFKIKPDELPIILFDPECVLENMYQKKLEFKQFSKNFKLQFISKKEKL